MTNLWSSINRPRPKAIALIAFSVAFAACATPRPPQQHASFAAWVRRAERGPAYSRIVAPEVIYAIQAVLRYHADHRRWPVSPGDLVAPDQRDGRMVEFVRRNIDLQGGDAPFNLTVWDLGLHRNVVSIVSEDDIGIFTEPFARGSKDRVHDSRPGASLFFDALFRNL